MILPERRRWPRSAPAMELRAFVTLEAGAHPGIVRDFSEGGMGLSLEADGAGPGLDLGREVSLRFEWGDRSFSARARVRWLRRREDGRWDAGLEYVGRPEGQEIPALLDMDLVRIDPVWARSVPASLATRRQVLPFALVEDRVQVACLDPADEAALQAVARHIDRPLQAHAAEPDSLRRAILKVYGDSSRTGGERADDPVALCDELLYAAWLRQASDIHIDPGHDGVRVRLRVDGRLEEYRRLPAAVHPELLSRIKVLGGMDIAERRAPQDGRFTHAFAPGREVDVRVATLPTKHGERATLRLLAVEMERLTLENLGMSPRDLALAEQAIRRPHGLLLATGPTGCGKTTTLYAALRRIIAQRPVNAIAVQDPVEYDIPGVALVEVDPAQKVTFAKALRSILRHDPDVLLIGEIRDEETAGIAIRAALTGHLVLATLHTNSAPSAVTRLIDMGMDRYLIAAVLRLVISQRLVRRLCPYCRVQGVLAGDQAAALGRPEAAGQPVSSPKGCKYCAGRGFSGRVGLFEMLPVDDGISKSVARGSDEGALGAEMRRRGIPSIQDDAVEKLRSGLTSFDEALSAVAG